MKTVNIGLVGTGFMGKGHAMAYRLLPSVFNPPPAQPRLRVLGDVNPDLAERGARDFGFEEWVTGWEAVVAHPEVDVVDITAPNHLHKAIAIAAAEAGKHVYCEKPLALTAGDAREMLAAAERAGVKTLVGFNYLKNPAALAAKRMIEAGELGEIYHFHGAFQQDVLADPDQPFSWRFERAIAGSGALGDLGAHVIAMAQFLVGDFARVCGLARTFIRERPVASGAYGYDGQADRDAPKRVVENEDAVEVLVDFANGATGTITASRVATGRKVFLSYEVVGSKGTLTFVHERMNEFQVYFADDPGDRAGFRTVLVGPDHPYYKAFWPVAGCGLGFGDMKVIEVYELLDGIANAAPLYPDFRAGWQVSLAIDAILRSTEEAGWVAVGEGQP